MRWKTLSFLLVFLLFTASALAESTISVEPLKNSITVTETATYKIEITNHEATTQRYSLFSFVQGWDITPDPLKDKIIEVAPQQTKSTTIKATPTENFNPGLYSLALNIETDLGEKHLLDLNAYVSPEKPLDYLPSIKVTVDLEQSINPQQVQNIKLLLENRNPLNISELVIRLQSDLPGFNEETTVSLNPLEDKTVDLTITPDPLQTPGDYLLFFTLEKDGETVKVITQEINVKALTPDFQTEISQEKAFLKVTKTLLVKNPGNVRDTQTVTLPISFWQNLFTNSDAQIIKENDQRYLAWELTLESDQSTTLTLVQNYRVPFYLLIILIIFALVYLYLKAPFHLTKNAGSSQQDATLSELKITLHLKNITKRTMKDIEVVDLIPGIADIEKSLDVGTLKPHEVKHSKKGTLVKWKIAEIEPKEDRIITYKIKSKLKILGALKLPRAKVLYGKKNKRKTAYSNTYRISS